MKRSAVIALSGMVIALTACSAKTGEVNQPASSAQGSTAMHRPPAHVGSTLDLAGEKEKTLAVTLSKIINPATGTDGPPTDDTGKPNGNVYVAAMLTIKNTGNAPVEDHANNDAVLIGSNDQDYTPDAHHVTECTNFDADVYRLDAGESASGCVTFVVPSAVTPAKFKYAPKSGVQSDFGEWLIP